jgi:NAD(P)-dependent dehydrogenase (short-subunit alcohol dehydrogenase family)
MSLQFVVTGANRGIGYELARQLVHRGARVIATCRQPEAADALRELDVRLETLDIADADSTAAFARRLDGEAIDVLINNAGVGVDQATFETLDWDTVLRFFSTNAIGGMRLTQALLPNLRAGERKLIVNMTSRMGSIEDNTSGGSYAYRASKCALNMMTRSLSLDLRREGFTCLVLHPGWVATRMGGNSAPLSPQESASRMLELITELTHRDNGRFLDYRGESIPW